MSRTKIDVSLINNVSSPLNMGSNKIVSLANGTASTDAAAFGQIVGTRILQIIAISTTSNTSSATTSYTSSNLTGSITPASTSSKVAILVHTTVQPTSSSPASTDAYVSIFRGTSSGTNLGDATHGFVVASASLATPASDQWFFPCSMFYIDSPATSSSQTYTVCYRGSNATNSVGVAVGGGTSTMYLIEIG